MAHRRKHFKIYFFDLDFVGTTTMDCAGGKGPSKFEKFAGIFGKFFFKKYVDIVVVVF